MNDDNELLRYMRDFIVNVRPEFSSSEEVNLDLSFQDLGLGSMDFIELQVLMMDDYGIDIFKYLNENTPELSIKEFSYQLLKEEN